MLRPRRPHRPSPWPIWLLMAAWFCANCPQTLICTAVVWLGEARSFTHQQRLTSDVAHLLLGKKPHSLLSQIPDFPIAPAKSTLPPLPTLKKIDLAAEDTVVRLSPLLTLPLRAPSAPPATSALRAPPPHGPPRAVVVS